MSEYGSATPAPPAPSSGGSGHGYGILSADKGGRSPLGLLWGRGRTAGKIHRKLKFKGLIVAEDYTDNLLYLQ